LKKIFSVKNQHFGSIADLDPGGGGIQRLVQMQIWIQAVLSDLHDSIANPNPKGKSNEDLDPKHCFKWKKAVKGLTRP
jgi:hypothetical protein